MARLWLRVARVLWVLFALNAFVLVALTLWVTLGSVQSASPVLAASGVPLELYAVAFLLPIALSFLIAFVVSLLIILRRPRDGFALFISIFLLNLGASTASPAAGAFGGFFQHAPPWYNIPYLVSTLGSWPALIAFLLVYPDGHFVPRWSVAMAAFGAVSTTVWAFFPNVFSPAPTPTGLFGTVSAFFMTGSAVYVQVWRYRHYLSPLQRQQTKWFLFALAILVVTTLFYFLTPYASTATLTPDESVTHDLVGTLDGLLGFVVLPIAIGIAILRYRLWDIDLIIRKTLTYGLLSALLVAIYFLTIVALQRLVSSVTGTEQNEIITVASTLLIAALFIPLRHRVQSVIDRRFYRKKYDSAQVLQDFARTVRDETDLETLTGRLLEVVNETIQPQSATIWLSKTTLPRDQAP